MSVRNRSWAYLFISGHEPEPESLIIDVMPLEALKIPSVYDATWAATRQELKGYWALPYRTIPTKLVLLEAHFFKLVDEFGNRFELPNNPIGLFDINSQFISVYRYLNEDDDNPNKPAQYTSELNRVRLLILLGLAFKHVRQINDASVDAVQTTLVRSECAANLK